MPSLHHVPPPRQVVSAPVRHARPLFAGLFTGLVLAWFCSVQADEARQPEYLLPDRQRGTSAAVVVGDWPLVYTAQILPHDARGAVVAGSAKEQIRQVLGNLSHCLTTGGTQSASLVKLNFYATSQDVISLVQQELARQFTGPIKPAVSFVVTPLPDPGAVVAADAVAVAGGQMPKQVVLSPAAPPARPVAAILPGGTRIYIAGQAEPGNSLREATHKTLQSLRRTLHFLGRNEADIVQLKAFLSPMTQVDEARRAVAEFFGARPVPPCVFVQWLAGDKPSIEIELVAWGGRNRTGPVIEFLTPPEMRASPIYSRVAQTHHARTMFVSGLYAPQAAANAEAADQPEAGHREVVAVFDQLQDLLRRGGSDLGHLAKATYYVSTAAASNKLNELRPNYYDPQRPPAASKAMVRGVGRNGLGLTMDMIAVAAWKDAVEEYGPIEYGHALTAKDAALGWISLFDGATTYGWQDAKVVGGVLQAGQTTSRFGACELKAEVVQGGTLYLGDRAVRVAPGPFHFADTGAPQGPVSVRLGEGARLKSLRLRPLRLEPLFARDGLDGWQPIPYPPAAADRQTAWHMRGGRLSARGGPGCLEYQPRDFGDFALQIDVRTAARHANGGLFLRAVRGDFLNGYEAQIFNRAEDGDPARPAVWSTGALDDHCNARRLVSRDGHVFHLTVLAVGPHLATWINGYQQVDWTDTRPAHANPRQGRRVEPGALQLQAHDRDSVLEFSNLRIAPW